MTALRLRPALLAFAFVVIWLVAPAQASAQTPPKPTRHPFTMRQATPDAVYGQLDFSSSTTTVTGATLNHPTALSFDGQKGMYVVAQGENKVVYFPPGSPTATRTYDRAATYSYDCSCFKTPSAVAVSAAGEVYIADTDNNRVLVYPPTQSNGTQLPTRVYGQPDFITTRTAAGPSGLNTPSGIALDAAGNLYIADSGNNRVLVFGAWRNGDPTTNIAARRVIGQSSFASVGAGLSASAFNHPTGVAADTHGGVYVADFTNSRVLYFEADGNAAIRVYGQSSFTDMCGAGCAASETTFGKPQGIAVGTNDSLYIADPDNSRVLAYTAWKAGDPTTGIAVGRVYGQTSFAAHQSDGRAQTAATLDHPTGVSVTATGSPCIADTGNNRVLCYPATDTTATGVYGQPNFSYDLPNTPNPLGFGAAGGIVAGSNGDVYISDPQSGRVLFYPNGQTLPSRVYGQPDFYSASSDTGNAQLARPQGLALAANGDLLVADSWDGRVARYAAGSTTIATTYGGVYGAPNVVTHLNQPNDVAVAANGEIYIADMNNMRVVVLSSDGTAVTRVYGRPPPSAVSYVSNDPIYYQRYGITATNVALTPDDGLFVSAHGGNAVVHYSPGSILPDRVYGALNLFEGCESGYGCNQITSYAGATGIATNAAGDLWMADPGNCRVLYYPAGSTTPTRAYGQPDLDTHICGTSLTNMKRPGRVAAAADGTLYIGDDGNNRVLRYPPLPTGGAARLVFAAQPGEAMAKTAFRHQPVVMVVDDNGNRVTNYTGTVTLAIEPGTGADGAILGGTRSLALVNGMATFTDLSIDSMFRSQYQLVATSGTLTAADSEGFSVTGAPTSLSFDRYAPDYLLTHQSFSMVAFLRDADNMLVRGYSGTASIALKSGTGAAGASLTGTTTVPIVDGRAFFDDLSLSPVGQGYVLTIESGGFSAESRAFDVHSQPAALVFSTQPGNALERKTFGTQPVLSLRDVDDLPVSGYGTLTIGIKSGPQDGRLNGTTSATMYNGVLTFSDLGLSVSGTYVLSATYDGKLTVDSAPLTVAVQPPTLLVVNISIPPATPAGKPLKNVSVVARAMDESPATGYSANVTLSIKSGTGTAGATLNGTTTRALVNGFASFTDLSIDTPGQNYVLMASDGTLPAYDSSRFNISGPPAAISFSAQPGTASATFPMPATVRVSVTDAANNYIAAYTDPVTLHIKPGTGTPGATLTVPNPVVTATANFAGLVVDRAGTGYVLVAHMDGLTVESAPFDVTGVPTQIVFNQQPGSSVVGRTVTPTPVVTFLDAQGNVAKGFEGQITVALKPGTGTPGAGLTVSRIMAQQGIAWLYFVSVNAAGTGYVLTVSSPSLPGIRVDSAPFDVAPQPPIHLAFVTQPAATYAGEALSTPPAVAFFDDTNTRVSPPSRASVTLSVKSGPPGGELIGNQWTSFSWNDVAQFSNVTIRSAGTYVLTATFDNYSVDSAPFVVPPGRWLGPTGFVPVVGAQPGQPFAAQPTIRIIDSFGNLATNYTGTVHISLYDSYQSAAPVALSGTADQPVVNGIATFTDLAVPQAGASYYLVACILQDFYSRCRTGNYFGVSQNATHLNWIYPPTSTSANTLLPRVGIEALTADGSRAYNFSGTATLGITPGTGIGGATLNGTGTAPFAEGLARFDVTLDTPGAGYRLTATAGNLPPAISPAFAITHRTPIYLVFSTQPGDTAANSLFNPQPVLTITDLIGAVVTDYTGDVTITFPSPTTPSDPSPRLNGTRTVAVVNGVATFTDLSIDRPGTYAIGATAGALTARYSYPFQIVSATAPHLVFTTQPGNGTATLPLVPQPVVQVLDSTGNRVAYNGVVTLDLDGRDPLTGPWLFGSTGVMAVNGIANFTDVRLDTLGTHYRLRATADGAVGAISQAFDVTTAATVPAKLVFVTQPATNDNTQAGRALPQQPSVAVEDVQGRVVVGYTGTVTLGIKAGTGAAGAQARGTTTVAVTNGIASFSDVAIDMAGKGYVLVATAADLTPAESQPLDVLPSGAYVRMALRRQPQADPKSYVATLTLQNLSKQDVQRGWPVTLDFGSLVFNPKDTALNYVDGTNWRSLTTRRGVFVMPVALPVGSTRTFTLHLTLNRIPEAHATLKAGLQLTPYVQYQSNVLKGVSDDGSAIALSVRGGGDGKAGKNVRLTFFSATFAPNEPLWIVVAPSDAFSSTPHWAGGAGKVVLKTRTGIAPGVYQVTVYGWWSGITATATVTLR